MKQVIQREALLLITLAQGEGEVEEAGQPLEQAVVVLLLLPLTLPSPHNAQTLP